MVSNANKTVMYSQIAQAPVFPKKNQAIVFDSIENVKVKEYLLALEKRADPKNIFTASKITQNCFCVYFNRTSLVDDLAEEGNNFLNVRGTKSCYATVCRQAKTCDFSNVHPCVAHDIIKDKLTEFGVTPKFTVSHIRVEASRFAHIICFRRQFFVHPDDVCKIPSDFTIIHEDTSYHVYASYDEMI